MRLPSAGSGAGAGRLEDFRPAPVPGAGLAGQVEGCPASHEASELELATFGQKLNWLMLALVNTNGGPSRMLCCAPTWYLPSLPAVKDCPAVLVIFLEA